MPLQIAVQRLQFQFRDFCSQRLHRRPLICSDFAKQPSVHPQQPHGVFQQQADAVQTGRTSEQREFRFKASHTGSKRSTALGNVGRVAHQQIPRARIQHPQPIALK